MVKLPSRRVCWYGKLPARGDFVGKGLPPRWRSDWDGWLQRGLALAATTLDGATLRLVERLAVPASPGESAARLASLLDAAAEGPEALEAAIAVLPPHSGQGFQPAEAWPPQPASLWWPLAAGQDVVPRLAALPPEPGLLLVLLN
jgi:type VI secretion system protein ImpM